MNQTNSSSTTEETRLITDRRPTPLEINDLHKPDRFKAVESFCHGVQQDKGYNRIRAGLFTTHAWDAILETCMASDNPAIIACVTIRQLQAINHHDFFSFLASQFQSSNKETTSHSVVTITQFYAALDNFKLPTNQNLFKLPNLNIAFNTLRSSYSVLSGSDQTKVDENFFYRFQKAVKGQSRQIDAVIMRIRAHNSKHIVSSSSSQTTQSQVQPEGDDTHLPMAPEKSNARDTYMIPEFTHTKQIRTLHTVQQAFLHIAKFATFYIEALTEFHAIEVKDSTMVRDNTKHTIALNLNN